MTNNNDKSNIRDAKGKRQKSYRPIHTGIRRRSNASKRPAIGVAQSGQRPSGVSRHASTSCQSRTISGAWQPGQ